MAGTQTCRPRGAALQQTAENGEQCFQNPIANPAGQRQQHDLHEQHVQHHEFEETRRGRPAQPGYSLCTARVNRQEVLGVVQFEIWLLAPISMNPVPRFIWQPSVVGLPELRHENAVTRFQIRLQLIE